MHWNCGWDGRNLIIRVSFALGSVVGLGVGTASSREVFGIILGFRIPGYTWQYFYQIEELSLNILRGLS